MKIDKLQKDRFLRKDPNQNDSTKSAVYSVVNPAPKRGDDSFLKIGRPKGSEEDDGAPNVLTGTVITSCFIQTSALPSRVEIAGNDIKFFDDTYTQSNKVVGDTSRLVFTHGPGVVRGEVTQGFIFEKRASTHDTYDNVLSIYALPPKEGRMNYLYFGRDGRGLNWNINYMENVVNHTTTPVTQDIANGVWGVSGTINGATTLSPNIGLFFNNLMGLGLAEDGYSIYLASSGSGIIVVNSNVIPAYSTSIDLGSSVYKFNNLYVQAVNVTTITATTINATTVATEVFTGSTQRITGPGTINLTDLYTALETTALDQNFTLADGTDGQLKIIYIEDDGGSAIITVSSGNGFTTCTLNGQGDGVTLVYSSVAGWTCVGENSATFA